MLNLSKIHGKYSREQRVVLNHCRGLYLLSDFDWGSPNPWMRTHCCIKVANKGHTPAGRVFFGGLEMTRAQMTSYCTEVEAADQEHCMEDLILFYQKTQVEKEAVKHLKSILEKMKITLQQKLYFSKVNR